MNEQNETILRYTFPIFLTDVNYSDDDMRGRDVAAEVARNAARATYPNATGITVVSINRGPRNYIVRVAVVR